MVGARLIFIPGMGADERLFLPQRELGLDFEVPRLPVPERGDDMTSYARRIRDMLSLDGPCVLVGVSFGGMVAYELAAHCPAKSVLLVASCQDRRAIPRYYNAAEWVSRWIPDPLIRRRCAASSRMIARLESLSDEHYHLIRSMSLEIPVPLLRGVSRMILRWSPSPPPACPVRAIHGARDRIIPLRRVQADEIIPDGGHLISLTHAGAVNRFIETHLDGSRTPTATAV